MLNWMGQNPQGFKSTQGTIGNCGMLRAREVVLPREKHTDWLSSARWSALNTYVQATLYRLNRFDVGIYVCANTYMNVIIFSEERSHEFEAFWEEGFGELKQKGREKCCNNILISIKCYLTSNVCTLNLHSSANNFLIRFCLSHVSWTCVLL